jgi:hypothetical protein
MRKMKMKVLFTGRGWPHRCKNEWFCQSLQGGRNDQGGSAAEDCL